MVFSNIIIIKQSKNIIQHIIKATLAGKTLSNILTSKTRIEIIRKPIP